METTMVHQDPVDALSDEILFHIVTLLHHKDVSNLSACSRAWHTICNDPILWKCLVVRDFGTTQEFGSTDVLKTPTHLLSPRTTSNHVDTTDVKYWKELYRNQKRMSELKFLEWTIPPHTKNLVLPEQTQPDEGAPAGREGHAMVLLGDYLVMWGGFCNDPNVYILDTKQDLEEMRWYPVNVRGPTPSFRYGHSMTVIDPQTILIFGGLTRGSYLGEINDTYLLKIESKEQKTEEDKKSKRQKVHSENNGKEEQEDKEVQGLRYRKSKHGRGAKSLPFTFTWKKIRTGGNVPIGRGYHSAELTSQGDRVIVFGGISEADSIAGLAVLDVRTWTWLSADTLGVTGEAPSPRFGHTCKTFDNRMFFIGGGNGRDLLRSGIDFQDVYILHTDTLTWEKVDVPDGCPAPNSLGRCHTSCVVGPNIVFFGGCRSVCNELSVFDTNTLTFKDPSVGGMKPCPRISATMAFNGQYAFLWGGYATRSGYDFHVLKVATQQVEGNQSDTDDEDDSVSSLPMPLGRVLWLLSQSLLQTLPDQEEPE